MILNFLLGRNLKLSDKAEIELINRKLDYLNKQVNRLKNPHVKEYCKCDDCTGLCGDPFLVRLSR